jgi:hypothetical protein
VILQHCKKVFLQVICLHRQITHLTVICSWLVAARYHQHRSWMKKPQVAVRVQMLNHQVKVSVSFLNVSFWAHSTIMAGFFFTLNSRLKHINIVRIKPERDRYFVVFGPEVKVIYYFLFNRLETFVSFPCKTSTDFYLI